jgi:hypothetical protein
MTTKIQTKEASPVESGTYIIGQPANNSNRTVRTAVTISETHKAEIATMLDALFDEVFRADQARKSAASDDDQGGAS